MSGGSHIGSGSQGGGSGTPPPPPPTPPPPAPPQPNPQFLLHLQRWAQDVRPLEQQGFDAEKLGADFGKVALTSSIILNGGALVALPTLAQSLTATGRELVADMAVWFPMGIGFTFAAILCAYINFMAVSRAYWALATKRGRELDCQYSGHDPKKDAKWQEAVRKNKKADRVVAATQALAVLFAISSFVAFVIGVAGFITLAKYNTAGIAR